MPNFSCNSTIFVTGPSAREAAIRGAFGVWNQALQSAAVQGIPRFDWTTIPSLVDVTVSDLTPTISGGSPTWCGHSSAVQNETATINMDQDPTCDNHDAFGAIMVHEFAHILGFPQSSHKVGAAGVSDHCAIHLPDSVPGGGGPQLVGPPVNSGVCAHEVEIIYEAYGQRSGPFSSTDFWGRHIVTGLSTSPSSVTLSPFQTAQITVSQLIFPRGQSSAQPLGGTVLSWETGNIGVAEVSPSGLVTAGNDSGHTNVTVKVSDVPGPYLLGTALNVIGDSITVTNSGPGGGGGGGGGGGFRINDITGPATPITANGFYTLTAVPVNQPANTTLLVQWKIDYSNTPGVVTTAFLPSMTYTLSVPEGSYSIEVTAIPKAETAGGSTIPGTKRIEQFPVCTSGGGGGEGPFLTTGEGGGGGTTTAVEGC